MIDFDSWIAERGSHLYTRAGYLAAGAWPSCVSDAHARALLANAQIFFHDKLGNLPTLVNPDLQPNWKPASAKYRKTL
jgi:hypothetical protein